MDYFLRCITCKKEYQPKEDFYFCPVCGERFGTLEVLYDYNRINLNRDDFSKEKSMFQFEKLLPTKSHTQLDQFVGPTPLLKFKDFLGIDEVLIKYDGTNFSASYKDRASIIAINKALEEQKDTIFCASTGNAATSLAMLSASTPLKTYIFVPNTIPIGKRLQLEVSGANILAVDDNYDVAFDLSMSIGLKKGWYLRNSAINPYLLEGKKTGAFEIIVQNDYQAIDYVIVSVGDGTVISSIYKGFYEFKKVGLIDYMPKIIGIQSENLDAIKQTFEKGKPYTPVDLKGTTIADSIAVGKPRDVIKACHYIEASKGYFITASDEEIKEAIIELGNKTGIFAEPAGAITYAGLKKLVHEEKIKKEDRVCILVTGNGLKDPDVLKSSIQNDFLSEDEVRRRFNED
jgi:threonine synthase